MRLIVGLDGHGKATFLIFTVVLIADFLRFCFPSPEIGLPEVLWERTQKKHFLIYAVPKIPKATRLRIDSSNSISKSMLRPRFHTRPSGRRNTKRSRLVLVHALSHTTWNIFHAMLSSIASKRRDGRSPTTARNGCWSAALLVIATRKSGLRSVA
jgi:hypothetical protein